MMMFTFMCVILLSLLVGLIIFIVWADAEIDKEVYIETTVLEERVDLIKERYSYLKLKFVKDKILPEEKKAPVVQERHVMGMSCKDRLMAGAKGF